MTHWPDSEMFWFPNEGGEIRRKVFVKGEGKPVLILQELPGFGEQAVKFAEQVIDEGFRVYFPHLLGKLGKEDNTQAVLNIVRNYCILREFQFFASGRQSRIADWMRDLCAEISDRESGAKIGVLGMCMTGSFAIPLIAEPSVAGAVASQPSLPFKPVQGLHMSPGDVSLARDAMKTKGPAIAMRYRKDTICQPRHVSDLYDAFKPHLETEEYEELPGRTGKRPAHALMTVDQHPEAYARVIDYFRARL